MGYAIPQQVTLETETCCECGVIFAMPDYIIRRRKTEGGEFYCPNGHGQHYTKTEVIKLREMLEQANRRNTTLTAEVGRARQEAEKAEKEKKRLLKRS